MKRIEGLARKAINEYDMLHEHDRVAVGVSGGKDSVALLQALYNLRGYIGIDYSLAAITLDPVFGGKEADYSPIERLCEDLDVEYVVKRTDIGRVVFDERGEKNPCSLCARMRRGLLHDTAKELGCNIVALGHHMDDAVETFFLNLFHEGRIGCFSPVTHLTRKELYMIRPLVLCEEREISAAITHAGLPVVKSRCPVDGHTAREEVKDFIRAKMREDENFKTMIFGAMRRSHLNGF